MAIYAIGDVQGCYQQLQNILEVINFDNKYDKLWFVGDIVNRGPDSLQTLRFIRSLGDHAITVLGNHDLHLLAVAHGRGVPHKKDTLHDILNAPDRELLLDWLQHRPLLHYDKHMDICLVHAGIYPAWSIEDALIHASEVEAILQSSKDHEFFHHMYGDKPPRWSENLAGWDRLRFITNVFTRMRYVDKQHGELHLKDKSAPGNQPENIVPWFLAPDRKTSNHKIIFGHWSTLPDPHLPNIYPLDTGCLWGGTLTALRIDTEPTTVAKINCPQSLAIDVTHGFKKDKHHKQMEH